MKIFLFGAGYMAETLIEQIGVIPENIEVVGLSDNNSDKWNKYLYGKPVYSPQRMKEFTFDKLVIMSDIYFQAIKENLIYWYNIEPQKIANKAFLLKLLFIEKYKNTEDAEIQEILRYWEDHDISVYNQYVKEGVEKYIVQWDCIENMPYIVYEDKKMYFPYDYVFQEVNGQKVVMDVGLEQQFTSPHLYITSNMVIEQGDIIADAGVQEGNFALRYIEKVSKAYLFESNTRWIKPLQKTFEKFKNKVVLYNKALGQYNGIKNINLDTAIKGKLDFLKMDVEGAEIDSLLGGKNILLNNNVKCSICSYHKYGDETGIKSILQSYGYETSTSKGYMVFIYDKNIYSTVDFRRGIVYAQK